MDNLLSEIDYLFVLAEQKIKAIEHLDGGLYLPAVNQLRYVAFHLLRSEKSASEDIKKEELRKAINHCQRAIYDAVECGTTHYLEKIKIFQEDYARVIIPDIIPNYVEITKLANDASDFISKITRESISDHCNNRGDQYKESSAFFDKLKIQSELLESSRPELNKKLQKDREKLVILLGTFVLTAVGILVTIIIK